MGFSLLDLPQFSVDATFLHQLRMTALLFYATLIEHDNCIGIDDGR